MTHMAGSDETHWLQIGYLLNSDFSILTAEVCSGGFYSPSTAQCLHLPTLRIEVSDQNSQTLSSRNT
jgi:hypothetical protein